MYLWFVNQISVVFAAVMLLYYILVTIISFIQFKPGMKPHHYQLGFAMILAAIIPLLFLRVIGPNDFIVGTFWGNIVIGLFSIVIDSPDLARHFMKMVKWFKKRRVKIYY